MNERVLWSVTLAATVVGLLLGPCFVFESDMVRYWIPWERATGGTRPWDAYNVANCNYPPVVLYLLTLVEATRQAIGIDAVSRANWVLVKLPNLLAMSAGVVVLYRSMRIDLGERRAAWIAFAWLASGNLFVNAAIWGQWDALLALVILLALLNVRVGRHFRAGAWVGLALAMKVQAIFVLPALGVGLLTLPGGSIAGHWRVAVGLRAAGTAIAGAMVAIAICNAPMVLAGRTRDVVRVYTHSVDTFPRRTVNAWNIWLLANTAETRVRDIAKTVANDDGRPVIGRAQPGTLLRKITYKRAGQAMFATYLAAVLLVVARRRRVEDLLAAVPVTGVAMFMLCTQMHERYIGPPAALLVLTLAFRGGGGIWWAHFVFWSLSAALNQLGAMYERDYLHLVPRRYYYELFTIAFSAANVAAFAALTVSFLRGQFEWTPAAKRRTELKPERTTSRLVGSMT